MAISKVPETINAGEDLEKQEFYQTVGRDVNWFNSCGKQYGGFLKDFNLIYHIYSLCCARDS